MDYVNARRTPLNIRSFTVGASRTINLGNYESIRVEGQVITDLPDTTTEADFIAAKEQAQHVLRELLEQTYKAQYSERAKRF